jgi:hypothetical protein
MLHSHKKVKIETTIGADVTGQIDLAAGWEQQRCWPALARQTVNKGRGRPFSPPMCTPYGVLVSE